MKQTSNSDIPVFWKENLQSEMDTERISICMEQM